MADSKITSILDSSRTYLGDFEETKYSELLLKRALVAAAMAVSIDTGVSITYNASSDEISPTPSDQLSNLLALAICVVLMVGEETSSALYTGGLSWRSGISSINFAGYHKSISESGSKLKSMYDKYVELYKINQVSDIGNIDVYSVDDVDYTKVN
jgi:hypothetical protein